MKLTDQMYVDYERIAGRVIDLQDQCHSNYPQSRYFVLELHTQELTSYKVKLEQMMEQTDKKE